MEVREKDKRKERDRQNKEKNASEADIEGQTLDAESDLVQGQVRSGGRGR